MIYGFSAKPLLNIALMAAILSAVISVGSKRFAAMSADKVVDGSFFNHLRVIAPPLDTAGITAEHPAFRMLLLNQPFAAVPAEHIFPIAVYLGQFPAEPGKTVPTTE